MTSTYQPVTPEQVASAEKRVVEASLARIADSPGHTDTWGKEKPNPVTNHVVATLELQSLLARKSAEVNLLPPEEVERIRKGLEHCASPDKCTGCPWYDRCVTVVDVVNAEFVSGQALRLIAHYRALLALEGKA